MRWGTRIGTAVSALVLAACQVDNITVEDLDGHDVAVNTDVPRDGCPTNWVPVSEADLLSGRVRVKDGGLTIQGGGGEVEVRGFIGATPRQDVGFVLRLDFGALSLGTSGRLKVELVAPLGVVTTLNVQAGGAVLLVESFPDGTNAELPLITPPSEGTLVLRSAPDLGLAARAYFGAAGHDKVLEAAVDRFAGGLVTATLTVYGDAEVRLDRFAAIDYTGGGTIDDFACATLGSEVGDEAWPATRNAHAGQPCSDDATCGAGEQCIDGTCQRVCLGSAECPGSHCLLRGDVGVCAPATGCTAGDGLVCGPDGRTRLGCAHRGDCPRDSDLCIGGACVNNDESAAVDGTPWGQCTLGSERCANDRVEVCDQGGPGWNQVERCARDACVISDGDAYCDDCFRSCKGADVWAQCGTATTASFESACVQPGAFCSIGDDATEPAHCRDTVAPGTPGTQVAISGWTIAATEVTRAEYAAFLASHPSTSAQPAECAWNTSFDPIAWPWFDAPQRAAQVDFCDARAYCASIGASVCSTDHWYQSCSAGGTLAYPYGDTLEAGRCSNDTKRDVASSPGCTTTVVGFTGVFDLSGGVGEWLDACASGSPDGPASDSCKTRGTSPSEPCTAERTVRRDSIAGIRCCVP